MGLSWLEARVYVHATEDRGKVLKALSTVVPFGSEGVEVKEDLFEGHYGNPILVLTVRVKDPVVAEKVFKDILSRLERHELRFLLETLEERVDKNGVLYLRISKQDAFYGEPRILEGDDVIRVSAGFKGGRRKAVEFYKGLVEAELESRG